jgi:phospholipase D1/2
VIEYITGPRLNRVRRSMARGGVLAMAAVRLVPVAPFTVVNLVAGASRIPFADYVLGTIIGIAPGLALMSALGHQIFGILTAPTLVNILVFILAVLAWLAVTITIQAMVLRWGRRNA